MFYAFKVINEVLNITKVSGFTPAETERIKEQGWTVYQTTDKTAIRDAESIYYMGAVRA